MSPQVEFVFALPAVLFFSLLSSDCKAQLFKPDLSRICKSKFSIPFFYVREATICDVSLEHIQYLISFLSVEV